MRDGRFSGNRWEILDNKSENGEDRRDNMAGRRGDEEESAGRNRNVEMEDRMEEVVEGNRATQERGGSVTDGGRKRNLEERSPGAHEGMRVNKRRVNEFERQAHDGKRTRLPQRAVRGRDRGQGQEEVGGGADDLG